MTNNDKRLIWVAESLAGKRLDVGLTLSGLCSSRSQAQKWIQDQLIVINNRLEKASYRLQKGDQIIADIPQPKSLELVPYDFPVDVVFEDDWVIVVNKPAGLVVHPAYGHESDTLINALLARNTKLAPDDEGFRPGLVHRIDKGTSGLLVLAKTEEAHSFLAKQFLKKTIHRRYWAFCFCNKPLEQGKIENLLTRDPNNRQRFKVSDNEQGKRAITHYQLLKKHGPFALYEIRLETGRTHQIRVHLSHQNNPIVGDEVYNGKNQAKNLKNQKLKSLISDMERFALHAKELGFVHPHSKEKVSFNSPLPDDLKRLFELSDFNEYFSES